MKSVDYKIPTFIFVAGYAVAIIIAFWFAAIAYVNSSV